jgi:nicotinamidase-related amidase
MSVEPESALLLIDLQESFLEAPALREERGALVRAVTELTAAARAQAVPIFLITTEHSRDRSTWTLRMLEDDQGYLFHGDPGTAVISELDTTGTTRIEKTRDSAFFGTDLGLRLRNLDKGHVVIAGVSTHACIAQTARDAYANNIRATIATDAIADDRPEHMHRILEVLAADQQAEMLRTDQILERWSR